MRTILILSFFLSGCASNVRDNDVEFILIEIHDAQRD